MKESDKASKEEVLAAIDALSPELSTELRAYVYERVNVALYNYGPPDTPFMVHEFVRSTAIAAIAWAVANGFIELTEKGTKALEGAEEIAPPELHIVEDDI